MAEGIFKPSVIGSITWNYRIVMENIHQWCRKELTEQAWDCYPKRLLAVLTWIDVNDKTVFSTSSTRTIWLFCFTLLIQWIIFLGVSSVQLLSRVWLFVTPWTAAHQASLSITNSRSLRNSCPLSRWCHPTISSSVVPFSSCPQSFPASGSFQISQSGWPKYWSFSFSISPSNEYPGLISFKMDWLNLLAVQGTLKSLLQHHSSKASILRGSAFFIVQFSHPFMTTGKTIPLTRRTFVSKVMSLLFNMLSRLVIAFLQRSKHLLISWL